MLELTRPRLTRATRDWLDHSVLESSADAYVQFLLDRGYAAGSIRSYVVSVAHFAHWLALRHDTLANVHEVAISGFVEKHLPVCRCAPRLPHVSYCVRPALLHLLKVLRAAQRIAPPSIIDPVAITNELRDVERHLAEVCGLSPTTRYARSRHVRAFLLDQFGARPLRLSRLRRSDVVDFLARYTADWKPQSKQCVVSSLRSYFRFKAIAGEPTTMLSAALPRLAHWRLATLPKALLPAELACLLRAFDLTSAIGKRDYAITRCCADLGLRTAEIVRLRLEDIDWQTGSLHIHSKSRRSDPLPLPAPTGRAIAAYLHTARPKSDARAVFLRQGPPVGRPVTASIVRNAVRYAAVRSGLQHRVSGPHVLRHTLATRLVQRGATLKEIADVLRHRSLDTTALYAKVDLPALSRVAMPWLGRLS